MPETQYPKSIARWETKGKDWLELYATESTMPHPHKPEVTVRHYSYKGNGCGGGYYAETDKEAISKMEAPWGDPEGTGQATVLRTDRPSLKQVR